MKRLARLVASLARSEGERLVGVDAGTRLSAAWEELHLLHSLSSEMTLGSAPESFITRTLTEVRETLGCSWTAPLKYTAKELHTGLDVEVDFSRENSKKGLDHSMRETWRDAMMRIPHHRYDRAGTEWGIDHNETMTYSKELKKTGEFLRRGWLRTILLGDMRTPARMRTGGWLRTSEAKCSECDVLDSIGHRLVCPRNQDLREQLQLTVLQLQEWPVCFTRCGIVPRAWPNDFEEDTATRMQTYLVDINLRAHVHEHTKAIMELASLRIRARRKVHDDEDPEPHEDELSTLRAAVRGTKRVADDYDG